MGYRLSPIAYHPGASRRAYTLMELLVVIVIIGVLAGLILPAVNGVKNRALIRKAQAELKQVEAGIASYKAKHGFYPPDNPGNPVSNQLYFELEGTILANNTYSTLDGGAQVNAGQLNAVFGTNVSGFMNSSKNANNTDEASVAANFLPGLKPGQVGSPDPGNIPQIKLLVCTVTWDQPAAYPVSSNPGLNPWRYNSSNPTNNPGSYDLWVDVIIQGKINRISNWSDRPQVNPQF